ncbi:hypothetical protein KEM54_003884 [Ascosphaera aggregata]|nr:hypothetical protein KEM54_003884 [Ascosphaera aggregata]
MDQFEPYKPGQELVEGLLQGYDGVILGPGPGTPLNPKDIGIMQGIVNHGKIPLLGICLGFQVLCRQFGASVEKLQAPKHGRVVKLAHAGCDAFRNLPDSVHVTLYHSLRVKLNHPVERHGWISAVDSAWDASGACPDLLPLAWHCGENHDDAVLMAVRHRNLPFYGVQFHPESCASSDYCRDVIRNWATDVNTFNQSRLPLTKSLREGLSETECSVDDAKLIRDFLGPAVEQTDSYAFRVIDMERGLNAERINELVNLSDLPTVVLESDSRYSIISALSPSSLMVSYSLFSQELTLELLAQNGRECKYSDVPVERVWSEIRNHMGIRHMSRRGCAQACSGYRDSNENSSASERPEIPFWGGYVGFASYEMGLDFYDCTKLDLHPDSKDLAFLFVDRSVVIDKSKKKIYIQSLRCEDDQVGEWLDTIARKLEQCPSPPPAHAYASTGHLKEGHFINERKEIKRLVEAAQITMPDEEVYKEQIVKCQDYIREGDSYELCLTAETKVTLPACQSDETDVLRSWLLYKRLQQFNPGAFSGYARLAGVSIVSSSPECFMQWNRDFDFEMKPMKGTVRKTNEMTWEKARKILGTEKEMGENLMIADLIRHDLTEMLGSRSTKVEKLCEVEDHGRVYQMITHVKSRPLPYKVSFIAEHLGKRAGMVSPHDFEPLRSTLPPGSMTGAPKIRSCQILADIEGRQRGVYSGVMGYLDVGGGGSFSVIIRTAFSWYNKQSQEEIWRIGAGGAVTALSTPDGEWEEMLTKLNTVLEIFRPTVMEDIAEASEKTLCWIDNVTWHWAWKPDLPVLDIYMEQKMA